MFFFVCGSCFFPRTYLNILYFFLYLYDIDTVYRTVRYNYYLNLAGSIRKIEEQV